MPFRTATANAPNRDAFLYRRGRFSTLRAVVHVRLMIKLTNFRITFADHDAQEFLLINSSLDWIIARPVALNNNAETKALIVSYSKTPSPFGISRQRLGKFMVDCLATDAFVHKAPLLSEQAT